MDDFFWRYRGRCGLIQFVFEGIETFRRFSVDVVVRCVEFGMMLIENFLADSKVYSFFLILFTSYVLIEPSIKLLDQVLESEKKTTPNDNVRGFDRNGREPVVFLQVIVANLVFPVVFGEGFSVSGRCW